MAPVILTLNAGSSSLKFALYDETERALLCGVVAGLGQVPSLALTKSPVRPPDLPDLAGRSSEAVLDTLLQWLNAQLDGDVVGAVGHRIVHGGRRFADPVRIDAAVLAELVPLAPLHQPHNLAAVRAVTRAQPALPQVGCFDMAFHRTMPGVATRVALPRAMGDAEMHRYGFHGLSYEFIAGRRRQPLRHARRAQHRDDDGLLHPRRPGDGHAAGLPGCRRRALPHAIPRHDGRRRRGFALSPIRPAGVSDISGDMRELAASTRPEAREAIALFTYRIAGEVGRLAAVLGGVDGLVFTAGIGEHDAMPRADICRRLAWIGIMPSPAAKASGQGRISIDASPVEVWVMPTDEEAVIARHTRALVS